MPDCTVMALTGGHLRVGEATAPGPRRIAMRATCMTIPPGAALRLSVQAAAWPAFAVNPGTGARPEDASAAEAEVTTLRILHGPVYPSRLLLPRLCAEVDHCASLLPANGIRRA
jgi:predicted acyl esterase